LLTAYSDNNKMKDQLSVIIAAVVFTYLAVRIYQKYFKKGGPVNKSGNTSGRSTSFPSSAKDDDYEPYSKK
jgi:hypothetical protein